MCKQHRAVSLCNLPAHQGKVHEHVSVWLDRLRICYHNQIDKLEDKNKTNRKQMKKSPGRTWALTLCWERPSVNMERLMEGDQLGPNTKEASAAVHSCTDAAQVGAQLCVRSSPAACCMSRSRDGICASSPSLPGDIQQLCHHWPRSWLKSRVRPPLRYLPNTDCLLATFTAAPPVLASLP